MEERYQKKNSHRISNGEKDFKFDYLYSRNGDIKKNSEDDSCFKNNNLSVKQKKGNFKNKKGSNCYENKNSRKDISNLKNIKSKKKKIKKNNKISEEINYYDNDSNLEFISNNFKNINSKLINNNLEIKNSENNSNLTNSEFNNSKIKNSDLKYKNSKENSEFNNNSEFQNNLYENSGYYNNLNYDNEIFNGKNEILKNNLNYPIMIDNDIEKFRIRLDSMLNKFKLESISEILKTKKNLLIDQSKFLSNEKKGFNMEIERLITEIKNQKEKVKIFEKKDRDNKIKIFRLSKKLGERTNFVKKLPILSQIFYFWKNNKQFTKIKRQKKNISLYFRKKRLSTKFFLNLKKIYYKNKLKKDKKAFENKKAMDFNSIIFKLNNNNNQLKKKINELQIELKNSLKNKQNLQKKIQDAFIKGINTINIETMTALDIPKSKTFSKTSIDKNINHIFSNTEVFQNAEKDIYSNSKGYDFIDCNEKEGGNGNSVFRNQNELFRNNNEVFRNDNELFRNNKEVFRNNNEVYGNKKRDGLGGNRKRDFMDNDGHFNFRNNKEVFNYGNNNHLRNNNENNNRNYDRDNNGNHDRDNLMKRNEKKKKFNDEKDLESYDFESNTFFEANLQSKESLWKKAPVLKNKETRFKEKIVEYDI